MMTEKQGLKARLAAHRKNAVELAYMAEQFKRRKFIALHQAAINLLVDEQRRIMALQIELAGKSESALRQSDSDGMVSTDGGESISEGPFCSSESMSGDTPEQISDKIVHALIDEDEVGENDEGRRDLIYRGALDTYRIEAESGSASRAMVEACKMALTVARGIRQ